MADLEKLNFFDSSIEGVQLLAAKLGCPLRTAGATRTGTLWPRPSTVHKRNGVRTARWSPAPPGGKLQDLLLERLSNGSGFGGIAARRACQK
jgi:hypothetical protein